MSARSLVATLALVVAGAACASSDQSAPVRVDARDVPFGLIDAPEPAAEEVGAERAVSLYYLDGGRLVEILRPSVTVPSARRALRGLLAGPSQSEQIFGATTALPSRASARLVHVRESVARVELARGFLDGAVADQPVALAQIVYTLTALPGIEQVRFTVGGDEVAVPTAAGTLVEGPVGRSSFSSLLAPAEPGGTSASARLGRMPAR